MLMGQITPIALKFFLALLTVLAIASINGASAEGDADAGEKVFKDCRACHDMERGKKKVGPNLAGIMGRKAGSRPDFEYSKAMMESGIVWDEKMLDTYLADPKRAISGTKTKFKGLRDAADRANLIAYIKKVTGGEATAPAAAEPAGESVRPADENEAPKQATPEGVPEATAETTPEPATAAPVEPATSAPPPEPARPPAQEAEAIPEPSPEPVELAAPEPVVEPSPAPAPDAVAPSAPGTDSIAESAPAVSATPPLEPAPMPVVETLPDSAPVAEAIAEPSVAPVPQPTAVNSPEAMPTAQLEATLGGEAAEQVQTVGAVPEAPKAEPKTEEPAALSPATQLEEATTSPPTAQKGEATPPPAVEVLSVAETQLKVQGDVKEAENLRQLREQLSQMQEAVLRQQDAQSDTPPVQDTIALATEPKPRWVDRRAGERRLRPVAPPEDEVVQDFGSRFIVRRGDQLIIRQDEMSETDRLLYGASDVDVEPMHDGHTRTTIRRSDGSQIVTERDRYGGIVSRIRIDRDGRQFVLFDNHEAYQDDWRQPVIDFEDELPMLQVNIPRDEYVVETRYANRRTIRTALEAPLVEEAERVYALDEVRASQRLRDKVRRIDLDTITFDSGSAALSPSQFRALRVVGEAMKDVVDDNPNEVFLIEGHTDAVGSDYDNLLLSDRRAEAVAVALSSNFDIPPENLITQGYGEQQLKIDTPGAERENRRIAIRRITELVRRGR